MAGMVSDIWARSTVVRTKGAFAAWAVAVCLVLAMPVWAAAERGQVAAEGRSVLEKYGDAVVTIRLATKARMAMEGREMQEEEGTDEILATMIDPSGLAVCSLASADPSQAFATMMGEEAGARFQLEITDVKIRLSDGKELPAKFVLRDNDLDLAFVRVTQPPAQPLTALDLTNAGPADVLSDILVLSRLGEVGSRAPVVTTDYPAAVIRKPRLMYVPEGQGADVGCPAMLPDGKALGILVYRFSPSGSQASGDDRRPLTVILPAADVLEAMKQVPK